MAYVAVFRDFGVTLTMAEDRVTGGLAGTTGTYQQPAPAPARSGERG